jgi:P27 family predicted phage terminase small subunit
MPARLPDARKALAGTLRPGRTAAGRAKDRGAPAHGKLWRIPAACPDREAKADFAAAWAELARAVNAASSASRSDKPAFHALVEARTLAMRAAELLEQDGVTITSGGGAVKAHPAAALWAQAQRVFLALSARFGLTPADRDRALALGDESKAADPLAEFAPRVRLVRS